MRATIAWWIVRFAMWFLLRTFSADFNLLECEILLSSEEEEYKFSREFLR